MQQQVLLSQTTEWALCLKNLTKYHRKSILLDSVSLNVPVGQIFGLLGPNGAGKSTLMKIIAGIVRPTTGTITIYGQDASRRSPQLRRVVGIVPQDSNLEREVTVIEALTIYGRLFAVPELKLRLETIMTEFSLHELRHKRVGTLSGGMTRRVLIARALLPNPQLLLLDEPTVGLDPDVRREIWQIIRGLAAAGKTMVLTTHYMEEAARLCGQIAIVKSGKLVILSTPAAIQQQFGGNSEEALETLFIRLAKGELP